MALPSYKHAQPFALRQLNLKYDLSNKNLQKKNNSKFTRQCKDSVNQLAVDFGRKSTIHGMNRIFQVNSNKYERVFWLLTFVSALLGTIYVCLILSQRFNAGSLQTTIDSTISPVFRIPFPEISICNANNLNWDRLEEAKHHFMPNENDSETLNMFEMVIGLYDNVTFGNFDHFATLNGKPIKLVEHINFSLVFDFMTWRCEEFLTDCTWRHYKFDCCDIFLKSKGKNGICWHFNTLSTKQGKLKQLLDKKYPWRTGSAGPRSGLTARVLLNVEKHHLQDNEKGIRVGVMEPEVFFIDQLWVPANTETVVEVEAVVYYYDDDTRSLSSSHRKCVFTDERHSFNFKSLAGFSYMIENCNTQCHQEHLIKYCNCTLDIFFPPAEYITCKIKDLLCLAKYNDYFRYTHQFGEEDYVRSDYQGMICNCFRNCYSLNYITDARPSFLPAYIRDNKSYVDLDIHFRFETMMLYRTSLVFGWVDLMVAFGGIAGLFLGCSLISAIELLYFVLIELPVFMRSKLRPAAKSNNIKAEQKNQRLLNKIPLKRRNWDLNNRIMATENFQNNEFSIYNNNLKNNNMH